jgi:hypothetical protein
MVIDYERAWHKLGEYVAEKTQHGREGLLVRMQEIAAECRVPAGELSRLLRLYGVEVERVREAEAETDSDEGEPIGGGAASPAVRVLPGHHDRGGHDGSRNGRAEVGRAAQG